MIPQVVDSFPNNSSPGPLLSFTDIIASCHGFYALKLLN